MGRHWLADGSDGNGSPILFWDEPAVSVPKLYPCKVRKFPRNVRGVPFLRVLCGCVELGIIIPEIPYRFGTRSFLNSLLTLNRRHVSVE
jgi:hypothetical protein